MSDRAERIEWAVGAAAALLVAAIVGFLLYEAAFGSDSLPELSVTTEARSENGRTHLRYAVVNAGGRTASEVTLSLALRDDGTLVDEQTVTIDYVPAHSRATGGLYLQGAENLEVELAVEGYVDP